MDTDDDMVVVIIGEGADENNDFPAPTNYNDNVESVDEEHDIEKIIETAATHGEFVHLKVKDEVAVDWEGKDGEYLHDYNDEWDAADGDEDYAPPDKNESDDEDEEDDLDYASGNEDGKQRKRMLKKSQQKSFVKELRDQYPELKMDTEALVTILSEIMRNVKPPAPPQDYFLMNGIMFECVCCGRISESIPAAGRHYQEKHGERYLICFACGVDFRSTTNLYKHEKRCVAPDAEIVLKARARALGRKGRSRPFIPKYIPDAPQGKNKRESKQTFACSQCPARFVTRAYVRSHELLHRGVMPHRCELCPAAYTSLAALSRHRKKHSDEVYICDYCNRSFKMKTALVTHLNTHLPMKKFGCEYCEKRYATKAALVLHVNSIHLKLPPPCVCKICHKRYPRMSILKEHTKRVHGLILMTRRMFFKSLPTMTNTTLEQAKVVLKSELEPDNYPDTPPSPESGSEIQIEDVPLCMQETVKAEREENETEENGTQQEIVLTEELLQYVESLKANCNDGESYNVVFIDNSELVNLNYEDIANGVHPDYHLVIQPADDHLVIQPADDVS